MTLKEFNGKIYITRIRKMPNTKARWVGAEIIKIHNLPTQNYLKKFVYPYISASTMQSKLMIALRKLQYGLISKDFVATIKTRRGKIEKIKIKRNGEYTRTPNDQYYEKFKSKKRNLLEYKWLKGNIAYVNFNTFSERSGIISKFNTIKKNLYKAKGIIIDLRYNGGGATDVAWYLQKHITKGNSFKNFAWQTRINDAVRKANGNWIKKYEKYYKYKAYRKEKGELIQIEDSIKKFTCPIIILIGKYTFSAAEDFLVNIYELENRPLLLGEETGGSTGSPLVIPNLPGGGYARICTRRICFPISENKFVNKGIVPDIEVKQTLNDYLNNIDTVLEKANNILFKKFSSSKKKLK